METVIINGEEYQQYLDENGHRVLLKEKDNFDIRITFSGNYEELDELKQ